MNLDLDLLASIASGGLGHWIEGEDGSQKYLKDDDCVACLKDLQNFFRHDDEEERPAFFAVSKYNFARSDLVPLIVTYPEDYDVVYNALKVCTFLTMASPAAATKHVTLQAERMQQVCEAFLAQDALAVIVGMLAEPLSRHPKMTDRDTALVELVITFLRNLLAATVPLPGVSPAAVEGGRRIRAGLVQRLFNDDVLDLVLLMAQHARERPFRSQATVLMDIFLNVFAGTSPTQLLGAEAALEAAKNARAVAAAATAANRARGGQPRRGPSAPLPTPSLPLPTVGRSVTRFGPARQQFAGAVYVRRHMDHANSVVVRHNPSRKELPNLPQVVDPRQAKAQRKDAISSAVANAGGGAVASASATNSGRAAAPPPAMALRDAQLAVRLNGLMARFLDEAYTPLMGQLFKDARAGLGVSRLEEEDFERFARFVATCTQYVRLREEAKLQARMAGGKEGKAGSGGDGTGDQIEAEDDEASPFECISSTMGWDAFHLVQILFSQAAEAHAARARAKVKLFSPFSLLYSLGPLLREMLLTLDLARVAGNAADRRAADRLQRRLLHDDGKDSGLLWALTRLIKDYNYQHQTRAYAVHLVEVLHVVLGTLDRVAADPSGFRVRKDAGRAHNSAAKGKKPAANKGNATPEAVQAEADAVPADEGHGDGAAGVAAADGSEGGDMDAADNAEGLTTEPSGQANAATGEEEGVETASQATADPASAPDTSKEDDKDHHEVEEEQTPAPEEDKAQPEEERVEDDDEPYTAPQAPAYKEVVIDLPQRLRKACAQPALVHFYTWLLRGYRTNGALANEAIVSFLERIAAPAPTGLGLHAMLWQLSVIRLFHTILTDPAVKNDPGHARLLKLCLTVTRTLLKRLAPDLTEAQARLEEARQEEEEAMALEAALGPEEAGEAVQGAKEKRRRAEAEIKAKEGAAALGFIEILFWKGPALAEILQAEYHWEKIIEPVTRPAGSGDGEGQLGFASYKAPTRGAVFSPEQEAELLEAFERCNGTKECLDTLVTEMGGAFKRTTISRKLKAMGLAKGKFTPRQEERLLQLYDEHGDKGPKYRFEAVAEDLAAGFSANQVKRQLQAMGIVPGGKKKGARARGSAAWDALLGSDDDVDAVVDPGPRSQERQARSGSDSSSASSSSSGSDDSSSDDSSDDEDDAIAADRAAKEDFWAEVAGEEGSASPGGAQEGAGEPMEAEPGEQGGTDEEDAAAEVEKKRRAAALDAKKSKKKLRHDGHAVDEHLAGPSRAPASPAPSPSPGGNKRKAPGGEVEGTPSPVKRARALAALRKKRFGAAADVGADPSGAAPEAATEHEVPLEKDTTQPETVVEEDGDDGQKENVAAGAGAAAASPAPAVKTFGRRLLKRTGTTEPAGEAMLFDDLEDF